MSYYYYRVNISAGNTLLFCYLYIHYTHGSGCYEYMDDLLALDACRSRTAQVSWPARMQAITTPLCWQAWDGYLAGHPDQRFRRYIVDGIRSGFRVGFDYTRSCSRSGRNMSSTRDHAHVVRDYLAVECAAGRVLGPLPPDDFPQVHVGVIPKKTPGKWRLIIDLSAPEGASVNDGVSSELCSMRYISVEHATRAVIAKGVGALLAKIDVARAYRNIPIHPDDRWLLGMIWDGSLFIDTALPFGLRSAPKIFSAVADAVEWILRQEGVQVVMHYLDDFLVVGASRSGECQHAVNIVLRVFATLGLPVAEDKLEGPSTLLSFLGLEIDTVAMELRLPAEKLRDLQILIRSWCGRRAASKRELESLIGSLNHACSVVRCGKTFLRRMFELLAVAHKSHHYLRLNISFKSDLMWWDSFLAPLNGVALRRTLEPSDVNFSFASDAAGTTGCGAIWSPFWFQFKWSESFRTSLLPLKDDSILFQELLPIVFACAVWGVKWRRSSVRVFCDNEGAVAVVNSGYSKVAQIMHLLRCLFFIRARFDLHLEAVHIPGVQNGLADAISRDKLDLLFTQVPAARESQVHLPRELVSLLVDNPVDWTSPTWSQRFRSCFLPA